jgi:protein involved in polysaccharide export with SLBB domain
LVVFPGTQEVSLVEAIVRAGGFTRLADKQHVTIRRRNADGTARVDVVDVEALLRGSNDGTYPLLPTDVIVVPELTKTR